MTFKFNQKTAVILFLVLIGLALFVTQQWTDLGKLVIGMLVGVIIGNIFRMLE